MRSNDVAIWLGLGGVLLYVYARRQQPAAGVPSLPWTLTDRALGFDPDYIPPPPARSIAIANQTTQPAFQGGTRTPSTIRTQVLESEAGSVYAGVPFMY